MNVTYEHKPATSFIGFSTSMNAASGCRSVSVPVCKRAGQNELETAEIVSTMTITGIS